MKNQSAAAGVILLMATPAGATGFTDIGQDLRTHVDTEIEVHGALRVRGELLHNLDLDRGPTPSGQLLYPVPLSDPNGQLLAGADLRLRTDIAFYTLGGGLAVKVRADVPDDLRLGADPDGIPAGSGTLRPPAAALSLKRFYGEVLTPIGLLAAGRMGSHWGLGMLTNGGDCVDCDSGDAADRIAFLTPIAGHIWAAAFDFSSSGPFGPRKSGPRTIDLDPADDVRSVTFAVLRYRDDAARERRRNAGKVTFEYGAYVAHRWQNRDVPTDYLPAAQARPTRSTQVMDRGYTASGGDVWLRLTFPEARIEAEAALLRAAVDQASLIPGVLFRDPVTSSQFGAVVESDFGRPEGPLSAGLDLGYASGDDAPGFGAFPRTDQARPRAGDLDGPQAAPPFDTTVDNFRFHPDYRIDRILFREIIGTVTDAAYLRPHVRWRLARVGAAALTASLAAVVSFAVEAGSTPGGKAPLGVELDPTLAYESRDGFGAALEHAILFPLAGLDDPTGALSAQPAQLVRMRLVYAF